MGFGEAPGITISGTTTRIRFPNSKPATKIAEPAHKDASSFGTVYANELASKVYSAKQQQPFPAGSIIVREKMSHPDATEPQLLAVMIKRETGFNPAANDWLFLTVDGSLSKVKGRTKKGSCLGCHESARDRDFVFALK